MSETKSHPIFAALFDRLSAAGEKRGLGDLRREVLAPAEGVCLEVGAGTGHNFAHYPAAVTEVIATEPDLAMRKRAGGAMDAAPVPVRMVPSTAERLPCEDSSIDTAVVTLVLCSVDDPDRALAELRRVLKPGGRMLFLEHVRSVDPKLAGWQDRIQPVWSFFAGGCKPNRDTAAAIERAGFEMDEFVEFDFRPGPPISRPHIRGVARNV